MLQTLLILYRLIFIFYKNSLQFKNKAKPNKGFSFFFLIRASTISLFFLTKLQLVIKRHIYHPWN